MKKIALLSLLLSLSIGAFAQKFLTDVLDSSTQIGKSNYAQFGEFDKLKFSGYIQPQYQWASDKGVKNYSGGDFATNSDNRFMLRRARIRMDYAHIGKNGKPQAYFVFQFDGSERGVNIRDFWGRIYINKFDLFYFTMGMFARPMGYEVLYSSSDRESPERGRMSQILMKTERDLGVMLTAEERTKGPEWHRKLKFDVGVFNGQGMSGPMEYDSHKDLIGRLSVKPTKLGKTKMTLSGGVAAYYGGIVSQSPIIYKLHGKGSAAAFIKDSAQSHQNEVMPRRYYDADVQFRIPNKKGFSELRLEYMTGTQTATAATSETPGTYPMSGNTAVPLYARPFAGAYVCFVQSLGMEKLQGILKYDFYDPNTALSGTDIKASNGFTPADIKYQTVGVGLLYHFNPHVKIVGYFEHPVNEATSLTGYTKDLNDDVLTLRVQYRF